MPRISTPVGAPREHPGAADHRKRLVDLRDRLFAAMDEAGPRELAPLAGRYQAVLDQLAAMPEAKEADGIDDLASVRRRRRAGAAAS